MCSIWHHVDDVGKRVLRFGLKEQVIEHSTHDCQWNGHHVCLVYLTHHAHDAYEYQQIECLLIHIQYYIQNPMTRKIVPQQQIGYAIKPPHLFADISKPQDVISRLYPLRQKFLPVEGHCHSRIISHLLQTRDNIPHYKLRRLLRRVLSCPKLFCISIIPARSDGRFPHSHGKPGQKADIFPECHTATQRVLRNHDLAQYNAQHKSRCNKEKQAATSLA